MKLEQSKYYEYIKTTDVVSEGVAGDFVLLSSLGFLFAFFWNQITPSPWAMTTTLSFGLFGYGVYVYKSYLKYLRTNADSRLDIEPGLLDLEATRFLLSLRGQHGKELWKVVVNIRRARKFFANLEVDTSTLEGLLNNLPELSMESFMAESWTSTISKELQMPVTVEVLLFAFLKSEPNFNEILQTLKLREQDFIAAVLEARVEDRRKIDAAKILDEKKLLNIQGIGKLWSGGFTLGLDESAKEITGEFARASMPHELSAIASQFELLVNALTTMPGNALLVGPSGSGKETCIELLALRSWAGKLPKPLNYKRIFLLEAGEYTTRPEDKERLEQLLYEAAAAGDVLIAINHIEKLYSETSGVYVGDVLEQFIKSNLRLIFTTTPSHKTHILQKHETLLNNVTEIDFSSASPDSTLFTALDYASPLSAQSGVTLSIPAVLKLIELGDEYMPDKANPEKTLLLVEKAFNRAVSTGTKTITRELAEAVLGEAAKVPLGTAGENDADKLLGLEEKLMAEVIGQRQALHQLAAALKRSRAGVRTGHRPIGSFLFCGPTGVGKTETCKSLARNYFGGESKMLRFDMSEFQTQEAIARLIDANTGILVNAVKQQPFSLILLDEVEKAYSGVLDLLLQMLDDGRLTDNEGNTVNFHNTIIVCTSNVGAAEIQTLTTQNTLDEDFQTQVKEIIKVSGAFRPELLNRFDDIVVYTPLSQNELRQVAEISLISLAKALKNQHGITIKPEPGFIDLWTKQGYSPEYGARPLKRILQDSVETYIADLVLQKKVKPGDIVPLPKTLLAK
ncbi:MAG TPA: AAA family ATPase [Patescibacteria group bacterium]|nr:AAA family ATPase [Patescibacteria group bacterium]